MTDEPTVAEVYRILVDFREEVRGKWAEEITRARDLATEATRTNAELRAAIFTGNGEAGLLSRVTRIEEWRATINRAIAAAAGALLGFFMGPR